MPSTVQKDGLNNTWKSKINNSLGNLKSEILMESETWDLLDLLVENILLCQESCHFKTCQSTCLGTFL
jgi:hypothetical protein